MNYSLCLGFWCISLHLSDCAFLSLSVLSKYEFCGSRQRDLSGLMNLKILSLLFWSKLNQRAATVTMIFLIDSENKHHSLMFLFTLNYNTTK